MLIVNVTIMLNIHDYIYLYMYDKGILWYTLYLTWVQELDFAVCYFFVFFAKK